MKSRLEMIRDEIEGRPTEQHFPLFDPQPAGCSVHGLYCDQGDFFDPLSQMRNQYRQFGHRPPPPRGDAGSWCAYCSIAKPSELCDICPRRSEPDLPSPPAARRRRNLFDWLIARETRRLLAKGKT